VLVTRRPAQPEPPRASGIGRDSGHRLSKDVVRGLALGERPEQPHEREPRPVGVCERGVRAVLRILQPLLDERREQVALGRELPGDAAHAGAGGDGRHRRVETLPREHLTRGAQQGRALALGVELAFLLGAGMYASFIVFPQFAQLPKSTGFGFGASVVVSRPYLLPSTVTGFTEPSLWRPAFCSCA